MTMPGMAGEVTAREVLKGLHPVDLRNLARNREVTTNFQAAAYIHRVRSRRPAGLRISADGQWSPVEKATIDGVYHSLGAQRLIQVDVQVCVSPPVYHVRLYVPLIHAELGYMAGRAMLPAPGDWVHRPRAEITAIILPEWSEQRAVLVDMNQAASYILGSDYYGDIHNSVLRIVAGIARRRGHLALHAGSAELVAGSRPTGELRRCGLLFVGAGGAGKTTLAACSYDLDAQAGEWACIRQDDRVILHPSGFAQGTEGQGLYVRTLGLGPQDRPGLYAACTHEDAVLENVWVNGDGSVDFGNDVLTSNGRAIVPIRRIGGADGQADLARCTHLFFLVRDEHLPAAGRLDADGAAGMLPDAESGDAELLLAFLRQNADVQSFCLNTDQAGASEAAAIVRDICRQGPLQ
jgi:phosphoenolpyruvate carboxykinase (ATP)